MAEATALLGCSVAAQNADILKAQEKHQALINKLSADVAGHEAALKEWAEANRTEFGEAQSLEFPNGWLRFRMGKRALDLRAGWTWKEVLAAMTGPWKKYLRPKVEPDKVALLKASDGDKPVLTSAQLTQIGLKVVQEESFEVECKPA